MERQEWRFRPPSKLSFLGSWDESPRPASSLGRVTLNIKLDMWGDHPQRSHCSTSRAVCPAADPLPRHPRQPTCTGAPSAFLSSGQRSTPWQQLWGSGARWSGPSSGPQCLFVPYFRNVWYEPTLSSFCRLKRKRQWPKATRVLKPSRRRSVGASSLGRLAQSLSAAHTHIPGAAAALPSPGSRRTLQVPLRTSFPDSKQALRAPRDHGLSTPTPRC